MTATFSQRIATQLDRLARIGEDHEMTTLAREIREERIPSLLEGRMTMVVLGEFNHGKSSTINALLGNSVLPTGITPTTSVITHIRRGEGSARLIRDEGEERVAPEALRTLLTTEAPNDLRWVEVEVASPFLTEGLIIVDTPGVNDISRQKVEITYGYVPRADVIVYVLDATQALKQSEIAFIQERLLRNSLDRLFFVLGKIDALTSDELEEVERHVRERLESIVGNVQLFPLSARRAVLGGDDHFEIFRGAVSAYLASQREAIVLDGGVRAGLRVASVMDQSLAIETGALALADDELARRVESARSRLSRSRSLVRENLDLIEKRTQEITSSARENTRQFVADFVAALPRELDRAQVEDIKRYLPDFILHTFKQFLEAEGEHLAMRLEKLAEEVITITNETMRDAMDGVEKDLGVQARSMDLEVDTFGYDVGVFALGALGVTFLAFSNALVGGLLTLSAPILAFAMKDRVDDTIRARALEQGKDAIERAGARVEAEFERVTSDFRQRLAQFVEDAGERLYRQISEALDRVARERRTATSETEPLKDRLLAGRREIADVVRSLRTLADERAGAAPSADTDAAE